MSKKTLAKGGAVFIGELAFILGVGYIITKWYQ